MAFLAMDLERLGAPELGAAFMDAYDEFWAESHPESLAHHYIAYRAHVRAKVACLRHEQGDMSAAPEAASLLAISLAHLERARIRMVLVGGLPASGKSTVAAGVADGLGFALFRSDEIRKDLAGIAHDAAARAALDSGLYRPNRVEAAYEEMLRRARMALERGVSVVLDATWRDEHMRTAARRVADSTCTELVEMRCVAPIEVLESRLAARRPPSAQGSDATVDVLAGMRFEAWRSATEINTNMDPAGSLSAALEMAAPERKR